MDVLIDTSTITDRVTRLTLTAESFQEERILRMILDGLLKEGIKFYMTRDGQPVESFEFSGGMILEEGGDHE
jgi:hypothetical protein